MEVKENLYGVEVAYPEGWFAKAYVMSGEPAIIIKKLPDTPQTPEQESKAALESAAKKFRGEMEKLLDSDIAELQNKTRTKVEYERCEFDHAWQAVKEHEESKNIFHCNESGEYPICGYDIHIIGECVRDGEIYRKVERPIEWWEDAAEFVFNMDIYSNKPTYENDLLQINASMTRDKWCDFARILLEQEGE